MLFEYKITDIITMNSKTLKQLVVVVSIFFTTQIYAQTELTNKVVDFTSLMPIESASVYVQNTTIGTITNADGKFSLIVPQENQSDTLVISSIGYKSFKSLVSEFDTTMEVYLEEDIASLDEVLLVAETRPKTGNEIVLKALERLEDNMPDSSYIQKGFLRHKERNKLEFKWLVESAITVYDSGYVTSSKDFLKVNVDQVRKSYDLRDVDSVFSYVAYANRNKKLGSRRLKVKDVNRNSLSETQLVKAIKWNDTRVNGLQNLFQGKLNILRNVNDTKALFGEDILEKHQFALDTILVDNERKLYKIKIDKSSEFVGLGTKGIYNEGFEAQGWMYIYYDNYAIKKIEYELIAASDVQKTRSKRLFDTQVNHKLILAYRDYQGKMYPSYIYYETPKLVNVGLKSSEKVSKEEEERYNREERYYYTVQEILFSELVLDKEIINEKLSAKWDADIFAPKPYDKKFWANYNVLLESEEDEKLIEDLTQRASLYKD
jgi:hypothetical protein